MDYEKIDINSIEKNWISALDLEENYLDWIKQSLPHPKYADFTLNSYQFEANKTSENLQLESYNKIKDSTWPECLCFQDLLNLPQHIIDECKDIHGFDFMIYQDTNIDQDRWNNFSNGKWPVWELVRYKHVILDLKDYLKDKTILDFAAHAGIISLMALHVGAKFVHTTNVRPKYVDLANAMLNLSEFKDKFKTFQADIHDYEHNEKICQGIDTVLLYGIMYHVHDHCQILDSITKANPPTIIIDTFVDNSIIDSENALIYWKTEPTNSPWAGWFDNQETVITGQPNFPWFKMYLSEKKYQPVYYKNYYSNNADSGVFNPSDRRSIMVFEKLQ